MKNKKSAVHSSDSFQTSGTSPTYEPVLTLDQVAIRLQLKPATVRELLRKRNPRPMPVLKAGKFLRFKWSLIEKWLNDSGRAA